MFMQVIGATGHGVRQTPTRQTRPSLQSESIAQKGVRSQLGRQNSSGAQVEPTWQVNALAQSGRHRPVTQRSPESHPADVVHVVEGRQKELMQRSPVRH